MKQEKLEEIQKMTEIAYGVKMTLDYIKAGLESGTLETLKRLYDAGYRNCKKLK